MRRIFSFVTAFSIMASFVVIPVSTHAAFWSSLGEVVPGQPIYHLEWNQLVNSANNRTTDIKYTYETNVEVTQIGRQRSSQVHIGGNLCLLNISGTTDCINNWADIFNKGDIGISNNLKVDNGYGRFKGHLIASGDGSTGGILVLAASGEQDLTGNSGAGWNIFTNSSNYLQIQQGSSTPIISIDSSGVSIGGTHLASAKLDVRGSGTLLRLQNKNNGTPANFSVDSSGVVTLSTSLTQSSDERLKKDITPLENTLEKLQHIDGVSYRWKEDGRDQDIQIGLIAQNVESQFPELVKTDENGMKSVNYSGMVSPLVQAIKELKQEKDTEIELLREQNQLLQQQIEELTQKVEDSQKTSWLSSLGL